MEEEEAKIEWAAEDEEGDGEEAEGTLQMVIPAIPERGIRRTVVKARGTRAQAAKQLAGKAAKLLSNPMVQAVLPPQAKIAMRAAQKLGKLLPGKLKRWLPW
jgi:hypothetical protein